MNSPVPEDDPRFHYAILSLQRSFAYLGKKCESQTRNFLTCVQGCSTATTEAAMTDCINRKCTQITNTMGECLNSQSQELEKTLERNRRLKDSLRKSCGTTFDDEKDLLDPNKTFSNPTACRTAITSYWETAIPPRDYPETEISSTLMQMMAMANQQSPYG